MVRTTTSLALLALVGSLGCAAEVDPPIVRNLDRPTSVAWGCYGDMRVTGGGAAEPGDDVIISAQPTASCGIRARGACTSEDACTASGTCVGLILDVNDNVVEPGLCIPTGQEDGPISPNFAAFVLQSSKGTVAVVQYPSVTNGVSSGGVQDADPLAPGKNALPIGVLPVGIVTAPKGCHVISANAGSCDLSVLDINSALETDRPALISRIGVTGANGPVLAKPRQIVAEPPTSVIGATCEDTVDGIVYVSYPQCNLVAAIEASSGNIVAGVKFDANGAVSITADDVSCAAECGDGNLVPVTRSAAGPNIDPDRPGPIEMSKDGTRLFIAAENNPAITVVELDGSRLPASVNRMTVEGDVGFRNIAVSGVLKMGGSLGSFGIGNAGDMQFVYGVASDRTVRVVEVNLLNGECDTQVDPRTIYDVSDVTLLSCIPVTAGYRRRPTARSPGIHVPDDAVPLDITFADVDNDGETLSSEPAPVDMVGHFAFLTASTGYIYVINVDDDHAPDFEDIGDPTATTLPLAAAHQLRDFGFSRNAIDGIAEDGSASSDKCTFPGAEVNLRGPRISLPVLASILSEDFIAYNEQRHMLPFVREEVCTTAEGNPIVVNELTFMADVSQREYAFPDLAALRNEQWTLVWEGILSEDDAGENIDGPQVRLGRVDTSSGAHIVDASAPFCAMGVEPYDIISMIGCDPLRGDAECGIGETCYVHPETPPSIVRGMCLPTTSIDQLSGVCRDVLVSRRRYSVVDTFKDRISFVERRRVLRTTPIEGCVDDNECVDFARVDAGLASTDHPFNRAVPDSEYSWACAADPSRSAGGPNTCQMTCQSSSDCEEGWHCNGGGFCVEAPVPPNQCVAALQRFGLSVGNAFRVLGSRSGYLHNRIADPSSGECIENPAGSPLLRGRIPLQAPACTGDGINDIMPNPCTATVEHSEFVVPYTWTGSACEPPLDGDGEPIVDSAGELQREVVTRTTTAIRFRNPGMTFHLVDPLTQGDLNCHGDHSGTRKPYATTYGGYQITFNTTGGAAPMFVGSMDTSGTRLRVGAAFPAVIEKSPDGSLWVLDQGDVLNPSDPTRGRIVSINPESAESTFDPVTLR